MRDVDVCGSCQNNFWSMSVGISIVSIISPCQRLAAVKCGTASKRKWEISPARNEYNIGRFLLEFSIFFFLIISVDIVFFLFFFVGGINFYSFSLCFFFLYVGDVIRFLSFLSGTSTFLPPELLLCTLSTLSNGSSAKQQVFGFCCLVIIFFERTSSVCLLFCQILRCHFTIQYSILKAWAFFVLFLFLFLKKNKQVELVFLLFFSWSSSQIWVNFIRRKEN